MAEGEKETRKRAGEYHGRLTFDPENNFHTDDDGNTVVTEDGGKTWRYASDDDDSHFDRYHQQFAGVDGTANRLAELSYEHGRERAEEMLREEQPHHFEPQEGDPHFAAGARSESGVVTHTRTTSVPDQKAATLTGHTDSTGWEGADA